MLSNRYMIEGPASLVAQRLARKVGALSRHRGFHRKVGITADPAVRWSRHRSTGWKWMELIYVSNNHNEVCFLERELIDRFHLSRVRTPGYHWNLARGGGGRLPAMGPYYLYVIGAPPYNRFT